MQELKYTASCTCVSSYNEKAYVVLETMLKILYFLQTSLHFTLYFALTNYCFRSLI